MNVYKYIIIIDVLKQMIEDGLRIGNVYEYAAQKILKY